MEHTKSSPMISYACDCRPTDPLPPPAFLPGATT